MFTVIKSLKQDDAVTIIYHLIMVLNKGKNTSDDAIEFDKITSKLSEDIEKIFNNILEEIDFINIDDDELLDKYIVELYNMLEEMTTSEKNLNLERGRERLRTWNLNKGH
ncbi:hypothetical protein CN930_12865 [Bacillus cereus]|nr:hypothetical protein CON40_26585 [Bacillus cereus]PGL38889.1 hypothetical protein CN930_12865 [Bacillus cereus]